MGDGVDGMQNQNLKPLLPLKPQNSEKAPGSIAGEGKTEAMLVVGARYWAPYQQLTILPGERAQWAYHKVEVETIYERHIFCWVLRGEKRLYRQSFYREELKAFKRGIAREGKRACSA